MLKRFCTKFRSDVANPAELLITIIPEFMKEWTSIWDEVEAASKAEAEQKDDDHGYASRHEMGTPQAPL